ncbi:MAG: hypothetical protein OXD30_01845, partial [Bryobacterales bacterium]|nr:hypothetical protein [Bryobacterales bacterium]
RVRAGDRVVSGGSERASARIDTPEKGTRKTEERAAKDSRIAAVIETGKRKIELAEGRQLGVYL